jgi:hypothetical protein
MSNNIKVLHLEPTTPIEWLAMPTAWTDPVVSLGPIECHALKEKSIYVDAQGVFYPCCWLGNTNDTLSNFENIQQHWNTDQQHPVCSATCSKNSSGTSFSNQWQREVEF